MNSLQFKDEHKLKGYTLCMKDLDLTLEKENIVHSNGCCCSSGEHCFKTKIKLVQISDTHGISGK
jgi:hypothetical protein